MSDNKALITINVDGKEKTYAVKLAFEGRILDEHDRVVGAFELRRQPDNDLSFTLWRGDEEIAFAVLRDGKDRRRLHAGWQAKEDVPRPEEHAKSPVSEPLRSETG